jgi:hypothetical protein
MKSSAIQNPPVHKDNNNAPGEFIAPGSFVHIGADPLAHSARRRPPAISALAALRAFKPERPPIADG